MTNTATKPKAPSFNALDVSLSRIGFTLSPVGSISKDWHVMRNNRSIGIVVIFPTPATAEIGPRGAPGVTFTDLEAAMDEITYLAGL